MKKAFLILLALSLLLTFSSCTTDKNGEDVLTDEHGHIADGHTHADESTGSTVHSHNPSGPALGHASSLELNFTETFNAEEDAQYHDLFIDKNFSEYENKVFTKTGTFATVYDTFSKIERYYVWGYADQDRDSCYQWEFVMPEDTAVPTPGSLIEVTGTMVKDTKALDGYRLDNVSINIKEEAAAYDVDFDFLTLSPTLLRVQIQHLEAYPDSFNEKTLRIYGKTISEVTLGSSDSISSWNIHFTGSKDHLDVNIPVVIEGFFDITETQDGDHTHTSVIINSKTITAIG